MSSKSFRAESYQDTQSIGQYLDALSKGFEQGVFSVSRGETGIEFTPQGLLSFSVEGKARGAERKIKLTIKWNEGSEPEDDAPLSIKA